MLSTHRRFAVRVFFAALIGFSPCTAASAQSIEIVHAFQARPANPVGELLEVAPQVYLGASSGGGASNNGTVYALFRQSDGTWNTFVVHSFTGADGKRPASGLMRASNGSFYGTTELGGRFDKGTVYRISPSGVFTSLYSFSEPDGISPLAPLVEAPDGYLWGTTTNYGRDSHGSVFKISLSGTLLIVQQLTSAVGSRMLSPFVRAADGRLYGITESGGTAELPGGVIFRMTTTGSLTILHRFSSNEYGAKWIRAGIDGNIYGVTHYGGIRSAGLFFRVTTTGVVTYIKSFDPVDPDDMWYPVGAPVQTADGFFYGAADGFGLPNANFSGGVYRMTLTGKAQQIGTLGGAFGTGPSGAIVTSDGTIVGTTRLGEHPMPPLEPLFGLGAAFSVKTGEPIARFYSYGVNESQHPLGRLAQGADGRLYGTTCVGGLYNRGTVYRLDAGGATTLHSFSGPDGACPIGGVAFSADGALYGAAAFALPQPHGRIFTIAPDSTFNVVWQPSSEGWRFPLAAPAVGPDGALYITASGLVGGTPGGGVIRIGAGGTVTEFANMFSQSPNWFPGSALALANDGNMYGTTLSQEGGLYRVASDGTVSGVLMFPSATTLAFRSGVVQGADGRLYGSIQLGGAPGFGSLYASTLDGQVSVLHEFQGSDGLAPWGELLEVSPGRFLGVTSGGGPAGLDPYGSIFEITADGGFTTVHSFSETDGATPLGPLMRASDGTIYGTTARGGPLGGGVLFRIVAAPAAR